MKNVHYSSVSTISAIYKTEQASVVIQFTGVTRRKHGLGVESGSDADLSSFYYQLIVFLYLTMNFFF